MLTYDNFAKPLENAYVILGFGSMIVIAAGIGACFFGKWMLGVFGSITVVIAGTFLQFLIEAVQKQSARKRVLDLEKTYGLSHDESLEMLLPPDNVEGRAAWKAFIKGVWGNNALKKLPKPARIHYELIGQNIAPEDRQLDDSIAAQPERENHKRTKPLTVIIRLVLIIPLAIFLARPAVEVYSVVDYSSWLYETDPYWVCRWIINVPVATWAAVVFCLASAITISDYLHTKRIFPIFKLIGASITTAIFLFVFFILFALVPNTFIRVVLSVAASFVILCGICADISDEENAGSRSTSLVLIAALIIGGLPLFFAQLTVVKLDYFETREEFVRSKDKYSNLINSSTKGESSRFNEPLVVVVGEAGDLHPIHLKLNDDIAASSATEANILCMIDKQYHVLQSYGTASLKSHDKVIRLIELESGMEVSRFIVEGESLEKYPRTISRGGRILNGPKDPVIVKAIENKLENLYSGK